MARKVAERVRQCKKCNRETLHYKNVKEMSWAMHLFFTLITFGVWLLIWFLLAIFHLITKPMGGKWVCSICGSKGDGVQVYLENKPRLNMLSSKKKKTIVLLAYLGWFLVMVPMMMYSLRFYRYIKRIGLPFDIQAWFKIFLLYLPHKGNEILIFLNNLFRKAQKQDYIIVSFATAIFLAFIFKCARNSFQQKAKKFTGNKLKLTIELVPETTWYNNLRNYLGEEAWDKLRREIYVKYGHKCSLCGAKGLLHCHEIWEYDDKNHVQKLVDCVALCKMCHHVKHIGKAGILADEGKLDYNKIVEHFMEVNKCDKTTFNEHYKKIADQWERRSDYKWRVDFSVYKNEKNI